MRRADVIRRGSGLLLGAAMALSAACGGDGGEGQDGATRSQSGFCARVLDDVEEWVGPRRAEWSAPSERYGGTAVVSGSADLAGGMNGFASQDYWAVQHQNLVGLMTLVRLDEEIEPVPWLAASWEVSDDTTALTFHLRDDVFWHDGTPTTARDVAFTYRLATDPRAGFPNVSFFDGYVPGVEGVEVVDSLTVTLRMKGPRPGYMDPWRSVAILPAHLLEDVPPEEFRQHPWGSRCPVGNGPFVFQEHRPDERWAWEANPAFPEALGGRPYLDRYVYRVVSEPATALTELLNGRTDLFLTPPPGMASRIEDAPEVELRSYLSRTFAFVAWNSRRPQLADARVRRALTLGFDREEVVDGLLEGFGQTVHSTVPPWHWAYDRGLEGSLAHDPDRARALLDEAGWTDRDGDGVRENADGQPLRIEVKTITENPLWGEVVEIMQAQLREVGVRIVPRVVDYATLQAQFEDPERRDFDGFILGLVNEFRPDDSPLFHSGAFDEPYGWSGTLNPELDRLLDTLKVVADRDEALPLWHAYQAELVEEQPFTFLYYQERLAGVRERLRDVVLDVRGELVTVHEWWLAPEAPGGP